jgi:hypothetical protein
MALNAPFFPSLLWEKPHIGAMDQMMVESMPSPSWGIVFGVGRGWRVMWYIGGIGGVALSCTKFSAEMSCHV